MMLLLEAIGVDVGRGAGDVGPKSSSQAIIILSINDALYHS